jgi:hypothetical protein
MTTVRKEGEQLAVEVQYIRPGRFLRLHSIYCIRIFWYHEMHGSSFVLLIMGVSALDSMHALRCCCCDSM